MKHIKLFENFNSNIKNKKPSTKELFDMFTKINQDAKENGEDEVPLTDVEFYTDQINNIFFNYVTGKDNFPGAKKMAQDMAEYAKKEN